MHEAKYKELSEQIFNDQRMFRFNQKASNIVVDIEYLFDYIDLDDLADAFCTIIDCFMKKLRTFPGYKQLSFCFDCRNFVLTHGTTKRQIKEYKTRVSQSIKTWQRDGSDFVGLGQGEKWKVRHKSKTICISNQPLWGSSVLEALYIFTQLQKKFPEYTVIIPGKALNSVFNSLKIAPGTSLSKIWNTLITTTIKAEKEIKKATQEQPKVATNWTDAIAKEVDACKFQIAADYILATINNVPFEIPGYQTEYPHWVKSYYECLGGTSIMSAPYVAKMLWVRMYPSHKKDGSLGDSLTKNIIQDTFEAFEPYRYRISTDLGDKYCREWVINELVRCWRYGAHLGRCLGKNQFEIDMLRSTGSNMVTVLRRLNRLDPIIENNKSNSSDLTELQNRMAIVLAFLFRNCQSPEASLDLYEKIVVDCPNVFHMGTGVNLYESTYKGPIESNWQPLLHNAITDAKTKTAWARSISPVAYVREQFAMKGHGSK